MVGGRLKTVWSPERHPQPGSPDKDRKRNRGVYDAAVEPGNLRVGYDVGPTIDTRTGVGRYTAELQRSLTLQGARLLPYAIALRGSTPDGAARRRLPARLVQKLWMAGRGPSVERLLGGVDIVHATNFVLPSLKDSRGVVTIHDLSFFRKDIFPGGERLHDLVPWSIDRASGVITPTETVAAELNERLGVTPDRITVTPEGVSPVFFGATPLADAALERLGIRRPFAVAAGTIEPRKNLPALLQAWRRIADQTEGWTLVLAGPRGWGPELPRTPGVTLTGWVGDETLPGLLSAAEFFCYPSHYESFGLPPLEAMATGTPVLAGNYSCAKEVLADAALIVDSGDVDSIADGLTKLASDAALRKSLGFAGRARASSYTWERTASLTIGAYKAALV